MTHTYSTNLTGNHPKLLVYISDVHIQIQIRIWIRIQAFQSWIRTSIRIWIWIQTGWIQIQIQGKGFDLEFGFKGHEVDSDSRCLDWHITAVYHEYGYNIVIMSCVNCKFILKTQMDFIFHHAYSMLPM